MQFRAAAMIMPVVALFFQGCEPIEKVSEVPEIAFNSFELYQIDSLGIVIQAGELAFSFVDGDADIGLRIGDSDTVNLFLVPLEKVAADVYEMAENADTIKYRILDNEKFTRTGQNKTLKGEIRLQLFYFLPPAADTLRYDFYMVDRAGNKSNIESTTDIGFR